MKSAVTSSAPPAPSAEDAAIRGQADPLSHSPGNRCTAAGELAGPGSRRGGKVSHPVHPVGHPFFR